MHSGDGDDNVIAQIEAGLLKLKKIAAHGSTRRFRTSTLQNSAA